MSYESALKAYWKMNEASWNGTPDEVKDATANANDGTASGDATTQRGSWLGRCGTFDGTGDYVNCGNDSSLDLTDDITLSAWIYPFTNTSYNCILSKRHSQSGTCNYQMYLTGYGGNLGKLSWYSSDGEKISSAVIPTDEWSLVCVTLTNGTDLEFFVNGVSVGTSSTASVSSTTGILAIGRAGSYDAEFFNGLISEAAIWNRVLDDEEIESLFDYGSVSSISSTGLKGYWKMDEASWDGTPGEVIDSSGTGNDGTRGGDATTTQGSYQGRCGTLAGSGDYVSGDDSNLPLGTSARTISFWALPRKVNSTWQCVFYYGTYTSGQMIWLGINNANKWVISQYGGAITGGNVIQDTWVHVLLTLDGSNNYKIYENASESGSGNMGTNTNSNVCYFGREPTGGGAYFDGLIDDVAVWNRVLDSTEIENVYLYGVDYVSYIGEKHPRRFKHAQFPPLRSLVPGSGIRREGIWGPPTTDLEPSKLKRNLKAKFPPAKTLVTGSAKRYFKEYIEDPQLIPPRRFCRNLYAQFPPLKSLVPGSGTRREGIWGPPTTNLWPRWFSRFLKAQFPPIDSIQGKSQRSFYVIPLYTLSPNALTRFLDSKFPPLPIIVPGKTFRHPQLVRFYPLEPRQYWRVLYSKPAHPDWLRGSGVRRQPARPPLWLLFNEECVGLYRIAGVPMYELFVGEDSIPDFNAPAAEESASLPITHALTPPPSGSKTFKAVCKYVNEYGLKSLNEYVKSFTVSAAGAAVTPNPSSPVSVAVFNISDLYVQVIAYYYRYQDGANNADYWDLYIKTDGTTPDPTVDTPTSYAMDLDSDIEGLQEDLGPYAASTPFKMIIRTRRSSDSADDGNSTVYSLTVAPTPDTPTEKSTFLGNQNIDQNYVS